MRDCDERAIDLKPKAIPLPHGGGKIEIDEDSMNHCAFRRGYVDAKRNIPPREGDIKYLIGYSMVPDQIVIIRRLTNKEDILAELAKDDRKFSELHRAFPI